MTPGVWEELVELRKVTKDIFDLLCLLADSNITNFHLIAERTNIMRKNYPFLEDESESKKLEG